MTDQVDDFREYISETQKMRAYRGKIEPGSPLAPRPAPEPPPKPRPAPVEKKFSPHPLQQPMPNAAMTASSQNTTNLLVVAAIVVLSLAAVALIGVLLLK